LLSWPWLLGDGRGHPRCLFVAGGAWRGRVACGRRTENVGAARARGGVPPRGTLEHDRGPQGHSAGGEIGCRVRRVWCKRLWVRGRGRTRRPAGGIRGLEDRLRFFLREGGGAEAAGVSVIGRSGRSASLISELLFAVIGAGWELAGMGACSAEVGSETGLWGQRCLSADALLFRRPNHLRQGHN
jgi:hypothetical protein